MRALLARFAELQPRIAARCLTALFLAVLATPLTLHVLRIDSRFELTELRKLAPLPAWPKDTAGWRRLPGGIDTYLNDHFGLRPHVVNLHLWIGRQFGVSHTKNVLIGKDGWLFFAGDNNIQQSRGIDRFTEAELERWIASMEAHQRRLARRGIPLLVVIAPDPHSIYPEYLPDYAKNLAPTRLDQLAERLKQRPASFEFLDLRPALLAAKAHQRVYFQTDTHWNSRGAYAGYRAIIERLRVRFPTASMLEESDLTRLPTRAVRGTGWMLAPRGGIVEADIQLVAAERFKFNIVQQPPPPPRTYKQMPFIATANPRNGLRIAIVGDSYFGYMLGFFAGTASKLTWLRHGFVYFPHAELPNDTYDIAIFMMVQRGLRAPLAPPRPEP